MKICFRIYTLKKQWMLYFGVFILEYRFRHCSCYKNYILVRLPSLPSYRAVGWVRRGLGGGNYSPPWTIFYNSSTIWGNEMKIQLSLQIGKNNSVPTFSQRASCTASYLFTWFHVGQLGQSSKYLRGIVICLNSYSCKNTCNISILTFTTLISKCNPEKPDASVY